MNAASRFRLFLLLALPALVFLSSCSRFARNPYSSYKKTNDEAIPASKVGGPPWRR